MFLYRHWKLMSALLARCTIITVGILCCFFSTGAQQLTFKHLTVEEGLSQNTVTAIAQDSLGFMWFGTRNGLCRYDGYGFRIFESQPGSTSGLTSNAINSLQLDSASRLWIGTTNGLCLWDQTMGSILPMQSTFVNDSLNGQYNIGDLFIDTRGDFWVMAGAGGFHIFRKKKGEQHFNKCISLLDPPGNNEGFYGEFIEDNDGNIWIGTSRRGIWRFDREKEKFLPLPSTLAGSLAVTSMTKDRQGTIWVGTLSGLYTYPTGGETLVPVKGLKGQMVRSLYLDNAGRVIVGTDNGGLKIYSPSTQSFVQYDQASGTRNNLLHNSIQSIFQDRQHILWIGTYAGGVNYCNPAEVFKVYQTGIAETPLNSNIISGFAEDVNGNVWIATDRGGLNYLDRKSNTVRYLTHEPAQTNSLSTDIVQHVAMNSKGTLMIGTWQHGLDLYDPSQRRFTNYEHRDGDVHSIADNSINYVYEDSKGKLWLATNRGLSVADRPGVSGLTFTNFKKDPKKPNSISDSYIKTIFEDHLGDVWISTWFGLNKWDSVSGTFQNYNYNPHHLALFTKQYILSIGEDNDGNLLLATNDSGLLLYERATNKLLSFTKADGLPSNTVVGLEPDGHGRWWVSTSNGLVRYDPAKRTLTTYNRHDGLPSNEFRFNAHARLQSGELLFGGNNGFAMFHPDSVGLTPVIPKISITDFKVSNRLIGPEKDGILTNDVSVTNKVVLPPDMSSVSVGFVGINLVAPNSTRYAYRLDGIDKDWVYTSEQRFASYSYLPSGEFTFYIKAASGEGDWSKPVSLAITINPYWYNTTWFRLVCVTLIIATCWGVFKLRTRQLVRRKKVLEEAVRLRTKEIEQKNILLQEASEELQLQTEEVVKQRDHVEEQLHTINTLNEIGHKITAYLKKDELVSSIHNMINRFMDAPHLSIGQVSATREAIEFSTIRDHSNTIEEISVALSDTGRLSVISVLNNRVIVLGDTTTETSVYLQDHANKYGADNGERSAVYIPLVSMNGGVTGVLIVKSFQKNGFSAIHVDILKTLAGYIGIAYENATVYKEIEAQSRILSKQADRLKQLDEIKSRFFINISHEFRTPLTLIISPLEHLMENDQEAKWPQVRQQLEIMNNNAAHLLKLINQLLELKSLELNAERPSISMYDLVSLIRNVMRRFDHLADQFAMHFKVITTHPEVVVSMDREMIEKVFINLYSNAFKYTPRGGSITTTLSVSQKNDGDYIRIEISDSGRGIPSKDVPFIFDRFYQAGDPLNRIQEGSGVGLSIVKDYVLLHGGEVDVISEEGKGTTFIISLPCPVLMTGEPSVDGTIADEDTAYEEESEDKNQPLLLLIDDNDDVLSFMQLSLESDYRIVTADNGTSGMELANRHVPDIIICDVMMPVMDGIEYCRRIKSDPRTCHIPVVLLTAKTGENSQVIGLDAGADDYIAKPFKVKLLKARINNIISTRRKLHELFSSHRNFELVEFIANDHDKEFIQKLDCIIKVNVKNADFNQEVLTREIGMSKTQLYRKLKALTGKTVHEYIRNYRLRVAHDIISQSDHLIYEIAYEVGFSDAAYFSKSFHAYFGVWPKDLRKA